jgi:hypothetical protein
VAGLQFAFDPSKPPGNRIDHRIIKVKNEYLDYDKVIFLINQFLPLESFKLKLHY